MFNDYFKDLNKKINNIEFKNRTFLSRHKILYALLGGAGVILYWRGVWSFSDYLEKQSFLFSVIFSPLGSIILGAILLIMIGLLVQAFIGSDVIISGIKKEKRNIDKTEEEFLKEEEHVRSEEKLIEEIDEHLHDIEKRLHKEDTGKI